MAVAHEQVSDELMARAGRARVPIALSIVHSSALLREGLGDLLRHADVRIEGLFAGAAEVRSKPPLATAMSSGRTHVYRVCSDCGARSSDRWQQTQMASSR